MDNMDTVEVELEDLDYICKFTERLYVIVLNINSGKEISEDDYKIIQAIHKIMHEGNLPLYKVVCSDAPVTTTEAGLFDIANLSVT